MNPITIIAACAGLLLGGGLVFVVMNLFLGKTYKKTLAEAEKAAEIAKEQKLLEAKEKISRMQSDLDRQANQRNQKIQQNEQRIKQQQQQLQQKHGMTSQNSLSFGKMQ